MNFHRDFSGKKGTRKRKLIGSIAMKTGAVFFLRGEPTLFFSKDVALGVELWNRCLHKKSKLRIPIAKLPKKHLKIPRIKGYNIKNYYTLLKKQKSVIKRLLIMEHYGLVSLQRKKSGEICPRVTF